MFLTAILVIPLFASEPKALIQKTDVPTTLREIFAYHVENTSLNKAVARRSLKVYIEQFDPYKMYLLEGEIEPFLSLSDSEIQKFVKDFAKGNYSQFDKLDHVIQNSIIRSRAIRHRLKEKLLSSSEPWHAVSHIDYPGYPKTPAEHEARLAYYFGKWLEKQVQSDPELFASKERLEKTFALWDNRRIRDEKTYIYQDYAGNNLPDQQREHYFSLHVLKAVVRSLDAHSSYYSPDEASDFRAMLKKQLSGVGVVLTEDIGGVKVADLLLGGPAEKSGQINIGDYLVEVDGKSMVSVPFEEVLSQMKGKTGSSVSLGFTRGESVRYTLQLTREKIVMDSDRLTFDFEPHGDGIIGKIQLPSFYDNGDKVSAERDFRIALRELKAYGKLYGLVIDMRDNAGGFLTQAVKIAGLFIPKGVIVISKYRDGEVRYSRDVDGRLYFTGPLVLLTSKASASAAEIVAAALKDYGAALIVGDERTYGKGSMQYQTITEEDASIYYKVTVGRYYTISGKSTQIEGVHADIVVPSKYHPYNIGEKFLEFPLSGDQLNNKELAHIKALPTIKPLNSLEKILPTLKANSEARIAKNENFQLFLQSSAQDHGIDDLQMIESTQILKDVLFLQASQ